MKRQVDLEDNEPDERMAKIMKDIEEYKQYEKEIEEEGKHKDNLNTKILEDIQRRQEGRDDNVNELEAFTRKQLDMIQEDAANEDNNAD